MSKKWAFANSLATISDAFESAMEDRIRYKTALEQIAAASGYDERGETEVPSAMRMKKIAKDALRKTL